MRIDSRIIKTLQNLNYEQRGKFISLIYSEQLKEDRANIDPYILGIYEGLNIKIHKKRTGQTEKVKIIFNEITREFDNITDKDLELWRNAYPAVNLNIELNSMVAWLMANPANRKTNYEKFIINWLKKTQDRAGRLK